MGRGEHYQAESGSIVSEILTAEQVAAIKGGVGVIEYKSYWPRPLVELCKSHEALRAENGRLKSMLAAMEGDPEAVHVGALAAIEALRQCCGTKARIAELEKERDEAIAQRDALRAAIEAAIRKHGVLEILTSALAAKERP